MREYAAVKLSDEDRREQSLLQQSANMQTAFSFTTAALFMIAGIVIENRGNLSLDYLLISFSVITGLLILSLLFASIAQNRKKEESLTDIETLENIVTENYKSFESKAQQDKAIVEMMARVQKAKCEKNDRRARFVIWSMRLYYIALASSIVCFIIGVVLLLSQ